VEDWTWKERKMVEVEVEVKGNREKGGVKGKKGENRIWKVMDR